MTTNLTDWLYDQTLPLWHDRGIDLRGGGFEEALGLDGVSATLDFKRTLVQARQIYVFSHAYITTKDRAWLDAAATGYDFLTRYCWNGLTGGWSYSVTPNGQPFDDLLDLYTQAFVLFCSAWYSKASDSPVADEVIERTWTFIESRLAHPNGGFYENAHPIGGRADKRRQNPHMHLLEACLTLYQVGQETVWLNRAEAIVKLGLSHFIDDALLEYFDDDLSPVAHESQIIEPGHNYEWYWLLDLYQKLGGTMDVQEAMGKLYTHAETHGHHEESGLTIDQLDQQNAPLKTSSRLWPQTEWIKASAVKNKAVPEKACDLLWSHYLKDLNGQWTDQPLTDDFIPSTLKSPASSLYHIYCSINQLVEIQAT